MKLIFAWIAGLLSLFTHTATQAQNTTGDGKSLLWSISRKGMAKPSYLFGTIHMICVDDYLWTKTMKESLDNTDKVCFEMDLDDPAVMMQVATGLMQTNGKKLADYFTPDDYAIMKKYVHDSLGMDIAMFESMKPVALQSIIGSSGLNCSNPISYEDSIMKTAQRANKEILGLETPQEQLDALESIPTDTVVKQLMDELMQTSGNDSEYAQLINAYKAQNLPLLYKLITSGKELGEDMGVFLDQRNKKWIARMTDKMKDSSIFFAVGAGHLWGESGVINLLQQAGYIVKPVKD
jgi:hypothetical protein